MSKRPRRNHSAGLQGQSGAGSRSRVSGRLHSWRISSTSTRTRSRVGKRSWKAVRWTCSGRAAASGLQRRAVDVKALHAKIGELTLENDFLEGALSKAGLLNARR